MDNIERRVGAIVDVADRTVRFLGYGTYKGEEILSSDDGDLCGDLLEIGDIAVSKIELDCGKIIYECEAHISDEQSTTNRLVEYLKAGYDIVNIDIEDVRSGK
jgi:hypothetical protein